MVNLIARLLLVGLLLSGCTAAPFSLPPSATALPTSPPTAILSLTPPPANHAEAASSTPEKQPALLQIWISPDVPAQIAGGLAVGEGTEFTPDSARADVILDIRPTGTELARVDWIYALVTPFRGRLKDATLAEVKTAWFEALPGREIWLTAETRAVFTAWWGEPASGALHVESESDLIGAAWDAKADWALVPFEQLEPRWRVLRIDNRSPFDPAFRVDSYPLTVPITLTSRGEIGEIKLPHSNYDRSQVTVLAMSGVTALARRTAALMNQKGILYPASQIGGWLNAADLTHISNEVSFNPECLPEKAAVGEALFCSPPEYIRLLENVGADIIELTGNHNFDRGQEAYEYSLDLYRERGWEVYGGGANLSEAARPLLLEKNGNRLAFLGCNMSGPEIAWASDAKPGAAPCDFEGMQAQVRQLSSEGYLVIVTLQAFETEDYAPAPMQRPTEFVRLAEAGAVIVSGSQAHVPQGFKFAGNGLIHFGLGNLFFDQSDSSVSSRAFVDRHIFYQGRYLGVELFPIRLVEFGKPIPMRGEEREKFLEAILNASNW
jgi:hypothetical protein